MYLNDLCKLDCALLSQSKESDDNFPNVAVGTKSVLAELFSELVSVSGTKVGFWRHPQVFQPQVYQPQIQFRVHGLVV
jgi:hypothetical protein